MEPRTDAPTDVVVRSRGAWSVGKVGDRDPRPAVLADVLALLGPAAQGAATPSEGPADAPLLDIHALVTEVWGWVGFVRDGRVAIEGVDGRPLLLDAQDLALLDHVGTASTPARVAADSGLAADEVVVRLSRLAARGRLVATGATSETFERPAPSPIPLESPHQGPPLPGAQARPVAAEELVLGRHPDDHGSDDRLTVYAPWHDHIGPLLALGMLTAAARHHRGGALAERLEIRRPERAEAFLEHLRLARRPAVLLLSDYVWSVDANLDIARRALAIQPELLVIHGGPSCPKYEADAVRFFEEHGEVAHVLVRGEGEEVICDLLEAIAPTPDAPDRLRFDPVALAAIAGITFRDPADGTVVRTPERERIADLDALPSPYLTGEFDHIPSEAWHYCLSVETTRGCPYGCTFCDWGSSTMSRIRKFDHGRVAAEIEWATNRRTNALNIPDANFGIMSRDVETTQMVADARRRTGFPKVLVFYPAKNTTKHLVKIMDILGEAEISSAASLSLQSTDEGSLAAMDRSNIATEHFLALAADYRRRGHPLQGDLLLGIPEQTYESYRQDLQFMFDHEILTRTWPVQMLPNSPMNDPEYRERYGIVVDDQNLIAATASFTPEDRAAMVRLRVVDIVCERLGLLRHLMRWLQWDHGITATQLMDHLIDVTDADPERFPSITWTLGVFDLVPTVAVGWTELYDEVRRLLVEDFAVPDDDVLDCLLRLQRHLMPQPGRTFPHGIDLAHDVVAYYKDAARPLYDDGRAGTPPRPLADYPPARFEVLGDPLALCNIGPEVVGDSRSETIQGDFLIGSSFAYELRSDLTRNLPIVSVLGFRSPLFDDVIAEEEARRAAERDVEPDTELHGGIRVPVALVARSAKAAQRSRPG